VTPNWTVQLPDGHYAGPEPDGFMPRDEFVAYLERYAAQSQVPIGEHVAVKSVESLPDDGFMLRTSAGDIHANASQRGSGLTIGRGCRGLMPLTLGDSRLPETAQAPWFPGCTSSGCTSCASGSPRC